MEEKIESNRLSDEELEKGKHLFKGIGLKEKICWYLYNKARNGSELDQSFEQAQNTGNVVLKRYPELFEKIGKIGKKIIFTTSEEGRKLVEEIIKSI